MVVLIVLGVAAALCAVLLFFGVRLWRALGIVCGNIIGGVLPLLLLVSGNMLPVAVPVNGLTLGISTVLGLPGTLFCYAAKSILLI